jgi:hypothetical protein
MYIRKQLKANQPIKPGIHLLLPVYVKKTITDITGTVHGVLMKN